MIGYLYRSKDGELVEVPMTMAQREKRERNGKIRHKGRTLTRDIAAEHTPRRGNAFGGGKWPVLSESMGVQPDEIPEAMKQARDRGCNLNFTPDGRAILENPAHHRQACRATGMKDKSAFR